jgi:hypothetical protein
MWTLHECLLCAHQISNASPQWYIIFAIPKPKTRFHPRHALPLRSTKTSNYILLPHKTGICLEDLLPYITYFVTPSGTSAAPTSEIRAPAMLLPTAENLRI